MQILSLRHELLELAAYLGIQYRVGHSGIMTLSCLLIETIEAEGVKACLLSSLLY